MRSFRLVLYTVLCVLVLPLLSLAQVGGATLTVLNSETKSPIADCRVIITNINGQITTLYTSKAGEVHINNTDVERISFVHINYNTYQTTQTTDIFTSQGNHFIYLIPKENILDEVIVNSAYIPSNQGNTYRYNPIQASSSISVIGEPDVLRHISSLPGVSQGIESTLGLFVRGGNSGSNGLYFNDVPLYISSHLMGMVSVYPPDFVDKTTFQMGGITALKGNLSSSLLDVDIKRDYGAPFSGKASLSPYLSGVYTSIPLVKDRMSLQISARTSFAPLIYNVFAKKNDRVKVNIYDITSSINYKITNNHLLELFLFTTNDYFKVRLEQSALAQNWRATIGKLGWKAIFNEKLMLHTWAYYNTSYSAQISSGYKSGNTLDNTSGNTSDSTSPQNELGISSGLREISINTNARYAISSHLSVNFGASWQSQLFTPANKKYVSEEVDSSVEKRLTNTLYSIFAEASYTPTEKLDLCVGYRHVFQSNNGVYHNNFDLHALSHYYIGKHLGLEVTFDRMTQYYHTLEGLPTGWSLNILIPSDSRRPEEITHQYYAGLFIRKRRNNHLLNVSLGGYYRTIKHLITYTREVNAFGLNSDSWEDETAIGNGHSYGLELSASLHTKRISTTLAYTLSKTDRVFPKVNNGEPFPFKFDRRHILNLQTTFTAYTHQTKKGAEIEHKFNSVIAYSSGNRATLPTGYYEGIMPPYWSQIEDGMVYPPPFYHQIFDRQLLTAKNAFVMKDYFRIDLGYTLKVASSLKGHRVTNELSLTVFNVLNRHNPYTYFRENGAWKQLSIVPIMPSLRWSISW